jgi:hypothetical protein
MGNKLMHKYFVIMVPVFFLLIGIVIGGYLFVHTHSRSFLSLNPAKIQLTKRELAGLMASVGMNQLPGFVPLVVLETDKTVVINSPTPEARLDYVFFPKKDIKNIGEIAIQDKDYLVDAYLTARHIIETNNYINYKFYTNGPGHQKITYLHWHLLVD